MNRLYYLLAFTIPVTMFFSFYLRGTMSYLTYALAFVLIPFFELFLPQLDENLTALTEIDWKKSRYFDVLLWFMVPIQYALLFYFCFILSTKTLSTFELSGLILAMGIGCGVLGINVAHELGHRMNKAEQTLAKLLLSTSLYWHFFIEHNRGHHKNVATFHDAETSRRGENLYAFWVRSIKDSFLSAFKIDPTEMKKALMLQTVLPMFIYVMWGSLALVGFLLSALIGVILLESVNYIEHYGLERRETSPGRYEKVQVYHSWNANHLLSRTVLFDLSRHSDHHAFINRKYQLLRHSGQSPQMPTGYPGMLLLALIPPLWFKVMHKRIDTLHLENP